MELDVYKNLNEELIKNVQELKINVGSLERELVAANSKFFEEHQKHLEKEKKWLRIISELKRKLNRMCDNAMSELNYGDAFSETPPARPRLSVMRRSSMGVTMRSPLKSNSPNSTAQQIVTNNEPQHHPSTINEEGTNTEIENNTCYPAQKMWGLSNVEERSENLMPTSRENTENEPESSDCQSVDTTILSEVEVIPKSKNRVPTIRVDNRRATQVWDHCGPHGATGILTTAIASPYTATNINSNNCLAVTSAPSTETLDRLTMNFSQSLILHSTPRTSDTLNSSTLNPQTSLQSRVDESKTLTKSSSSLSSSRPKRQCAPKNLTEPTVNTKLRNEGKVFGKRQTKKKNRTK